MCNGSGPLILIQEHLAEAPGQFTSSWLKFASLGVRSVLKKTWEIAHVYFNLKHDFKCQTTIIFGMGEALQ